jgi:RNA polymerase sigma-70 factor (ECF subfamily)
MAVNQNLSDKAIQDLTLVKLAREGDQKAYAELLGKYRDTIYYMLLKMVNNPSDAEDLTIEAFGKAFRYIDQYTPNYAFSTWLFKIATNNCIDFIRKRRGSTISLDKSADPSDHHSLSVTIQSDHPDPEANLINQQKVILLREVVNKLKPRYRNLVEMRYFKELSYEEISRELNLPIGTVKAQLFRARELLYNILRHTTDQI